MYQQIKTLMLLTPKKITKEVFISKMKYKKIGKLNKKSIII